MGTMPTREEKQEWLNEFARSRGYAHRLYRVLVNYDLDALNAFNPAPNATYVTQRLLPEGQKELMLVAGFTCMRSPRYIIQSHIQKALSRGVPTSQVLEALEMTFLEAGRAAFEEGILSWAEIAAGASGREVEERMMTKAENDSAAAAVDADGVEVPARKYEQVLAAHDREIGEILRKIPETLYLKQRTLDPKTKELICIVMMTALKVPEYLLKAHIKRALALGVSEREILEALEMIITVVGLPQFEYGLMAWADVIDAEELHPEGAIFSRIPNS